MTVASLTEKPYLSFSRLNTYSSCPRKFQLSYIEKVPQSPQGALIAGRTVHNMIELAEHQQITDPDKLKSEFLSAFEAEVTEAGGADVVRWAGRKTKEFPNGEDYAWWCSQGPVMLKRYLSLREADRESGWTLDEASVEMAVNATLPSGTLLKTYIDAFLLITADGEAVIRDWKSGKPQASPDGIQLGTYAYAVEQVLGIKVTLGQYVYLRAPDAARQIVTLDLAPWQALIPEMYDDLERMLALEIYPMKPGPFCKSCSVASFCPYGLLVNKEG